MEPNLELLREEQTRLAKRILRSDGFNRLETVAGLDIAYTGAKIICSIVVCDYQTMRVRESKQLTGSTDFPHIHGFLSYREGPISVETYHNLELDPDVIFVDGDGILHPRFLGLASHLGLLLDKPTIGIAKELRYGEVKDDTIYINKEAVGKILATKEKARPIFVSPGHKMSLSSALEIAKACLRDHKLPEPLHLAHKFATKVRNRIKH